MRDRNQPLNVDVGGNLPEGLQALDRELSGIRIEERPSFGPELEAELGRAWRARPRGPRRSPAPWVKILLAACFGGVMLATVAVPSARAAVVRLVRTVLEEAVPSLFAPTPAAQAPPVRLEEPAPFAIDPTPPASDPPARPGLSEEAPPTVGIPTVESTFPQILFPEEARAIVASHYPLGLQKAGIGGSVKILLWITPEGMPESIQMREGSGYRSLDYAAQLAARDLRFRPATRAGNPVGTWVQFTVHFVPSDTGGVLELGPVGSEGVGGY